MNPTILLYAVGGVVFLVVLYIKGYLGIGDMFTAASVARPGKLLARPSSKDLFSKAVKAAMEEAHDEFAAQIADKMRANVVASHMSSFPGADPAAQPAPATPPAAPSAS